VLVASGCATWETLTFSPDRVYSDHTQNQTTQLYWVNKESRRNQHTYNKLLNLIPENRRDEFSGAFDSCVGNAQQTTEFAPLLSLVPSAAMYVFDFAADTLVGYAEDLQYRGDRGYSANLILVGEEANAVGGTSKVPGCLVLLRMATNGLKPPKTGMVTIIRIAAQDSILRFEPTYARFDNAMALTGHGEDGAGGQIDAFYAITVSVARPVQLGVYPKQVMIGVGEFSLHGVRLGTPDPALNCDSARPCLVQTKSLDRPDGASTSIEISIAVREIGTHVSDATRAQAQIKAVRDAVGPRIKTVVESMIVE
jgi:hypothetical protein